MRSQYAAATTLLLICSTAIAADDEGFRPLFNGKDLSGWVDVNTAPSTWTIKDGMLICSGKPIGELRTDRMYENFILEAEWRHMKPGGNAGIFVWADDITARGQPFIRGIEVQVLDNAYGKSNWFTTHGDIFPIHGAKMRPLTGHNVGKPNGRAFPTEHRSNPSPKWNHYRIVCKDGTISLSVNGKEVTRGADAVPRKGYICLESEGGIVHWRNIKVKELPPSGKLKPEHVAIKDRGFKSLYNGVDFTNWKFGDGHRGHWHAKDWVMDFDGKGDTLWTEKEYEDFELIVDWRWVNKPKKQMEPIILPSGDYAVDTDGKQKKAEVLDAGDSGIFLRGSGKYQLNIWCWPCGSGEMWGIRGDKRMPPAVRAGAVPKVRADRPIGQWNRFHIRCVGERVVVHLNDKLVIDNTIPGMKLKGAIGLQKHGDPIQFANIYIKELK